MSNDIKNNSVTPGSNDNGNPSVSYLEEIKRLKSALEEKEKLIARWHSFINNTDDAIILLNNLQIVEYNQKVLDLFGVSEEEFKKGNIFTFSPKFQEDGIDSRLKAIQIQKILREKKSYSFEWIFKKKNNVTFYTHITLTKIPELGENYVQGVIKDIDNLKRTQYELKVNVERFQNIVENASELIIRVDPSWKFIFTNKAFEVLLGYGERDLFGKDFFSLIPREHRDRIKNQLTNPELTGSLDYFEIPLKSANGKQFWFATYKKIIFKNDRVHRIQLSALNITEKKTLSDIQSVFLEISKTLLSDTKIEDIYPVIHREIEKLMPARNFYIAIYDNKTDTISFPYFVDKYDQPPKPRKLRRGLTEYVLRKGEPLLATKEVYLDLAKKGEIELIGEFSVDWLGVPLKAKDRTIGVIAVQSYDKEIRYDETSKDILTYASSQIALAIERKISEAEIESSFSLLKATMESTADGIMVEDLDGNVKLFNSKFLEYFGFSEEQVANADRSILINAVKDKIPDATRFLRHANAVYKTPDEILVDYLEFIDGTIYEVQTHPQKMNGQIVGLVWSFRDITEQKTAQKAIEYERYLLQMLMDNIPDSIYFKDKDCKFIRINKAQVRVLGVLNEKEALGKTDFDFFEKDAALESFNDEIQIMKTGRPIINKEEKISLPGKPPKWFSATKAPFYDETGNVAGIVGISRDITKMKETEERLREYSEELKEANATKDRFLSIIAHDLKSPFGTLLGFLELMHEDFDEIGKDELKNFIGMAHGSARKIFNLLQNLLEWAYMQKGQIKYNPVELDLNPFVDEAVEILEDKAKEKQLSIINNTDKGLKINVDKTMIQTVIRNIVNNALKFTPEGGSITITASESHNNMIRISITDTGIGMSEEDRNKLFKLDAHHSTKGTAGETGTGLGLIICKEMVEKNGGEIWVESELGKGTTFHFTVPKA